MLDSLHLGTTCRDILGDRRVAEEAAGLANVLIYCPMLFWEMFELQ